MQYTQVKSDAFETLQLNAGIMCDDFTPASGTLGNILGATSGGLSFASNPNFVDFGEDVDNAPANTYQLKKVVSFDPVISGTFISIDASLAKTLNGAGAIDSDDSTHIVPSHDLSESDFTDFWVIGDYSAYNDGTSTAGYVAVHIMYGLNTKGFQWKTNKDGKGQFEFEIHGHYDLDDVDTVPFEIYVKAGTASA